MSGLRQDCFKMLRQGPSVQYVVEDELQGPWLEQTHQNISDTEQGSHDHPFFAFSQMLAEKRDNIAEGTPLSESPAPPGRDKYAANLIHHMY